MINIFVEMEQGAGVLSYSLLLTLMGALLYIQAAVTAALQHLPLKGHLSVSLMLLKCCEWIKLYELHSRWSSATHSGWKTPALCSEMAGLRFESILPFIVKSCLNRLPVEMKDLEITNGWIMGRVFFFFFQQHVFSCFFTSWQYVIQTNLKAERVKLMEKN